MAINDFKLLFQMYCNQDGPIDLSRPVAPFNVQRGVLLDPGTGAGQVDRLWTDTRTLTASSTEDLDLVGAALFDPFGVAVTFARVKGLFVYANPANTNNVVVGANVVNGWATLIGPTGASGGTITLRPGGGAALFSGADATGHVTTAGTGDLLHVANSGAGTSVIYDIGVIGCSV